MSLLTHPGRCYDLAAVYQWLERRTPVDRFTLKSPGPSSINELFEAMDEALALTSTGQGVGAPAFDHGRMLFERITLSLQRALNHELAQAHTDLRQATNALKIATWWLAVVTVALGIVEVYKLIVH